MAGNLLLEKQEGKEKKLDAAKEAIRAEDQAKGIYYQPKQRKEQINEEDKEFTPVDA